MSKTAIFLYGPAGCGKGTQGETLLARNPGMIRIEMGEIIRSYVRDHADSSDESKKQLASKIMERIDVGRAVDFAQWSELWEAAIVPQLEQYDLFLFDGFFRGIEQSELVAKTMHSYGFDVKIVWIHISLEEALRRLTNRGRKDDTNPNVIMTRYNSQYNEQFATCLQEVQQHCAVKLYMFSGAQQPMQLAQRISEIL